jgi:hypothetical protein
MEIRTPHTIDVRSLNEKRFFHGKQPCGIRLEVVKFFLFFFCNNKLLFIIICIWLSQRNVNCSYHIQKKFSLSFARLCDARWKVFLSFFLFYNNLLFFCCCDMPVHHWCYISSTLFIYRTLLIWHCIN